MFRNRTVDKNVTKYCRSCGVAVSDLWSYLIMFVFLCSVFFSLSTPYVHGCATAVCGGQGGRQHHTELHRLRQPQACGHLVARGRAAGHQQKIHGNVCSGFTEWLNWCHVISHYESFHPGELIPASEKWETDHVYWFGLTPSLQAWYCMYSSCGNKGIVLSCFERK